MFYAEKEDRDRWKQFFRDFSYKPNWEFKVRDNWDIVMNVMGDLRVEMVMRVPNSREPRRLPETWPTSGKRTVEPLIPITKSVVLGVYDSDEHARKFIWLHIQEMEAHEMGEWFRHKGELNFDPHKEETT